MLRKSATPGPLTPIYLTIVSIYLFALAPGFLPPAAASSRVYHRTPAAHLARRLLGMFALLLTQCIHATSEPSTQELAATFATQSSQISALVATVAQQAARISELEARMSTPAGSAPAEAREGRRLSASPASQRTIWHGDTLHAIDDPASCGLHSELHSNT